MGTNRQVIRRRVAPPALFLCLTFAACDFSTNLRDCGQTLSSIGSNEVDAQPPQTTSALVPLRPRGAPQEESPNDDVSPSASVSSDAGSPPVATYFRVPAFPAPAPAPPAAPAQASYPASAAPVPSAAPTATQAPNEAPPPADIVVLPEGNGVVPFSEPRAVAPHGDLPPSNVRAYPPFPQQAGVPSQPQAGVGLPQQVVQGVPQPEQVVTQPAQPSPPRTPQPGPIAIPPQLRPMP